MQRIKVPLIILGIVIVSIVFFVNIADTQSSEKQTVEGEVRNKEGDPIKDVMIEYFQGEETSPVTEPTYTDEDGKYTIEFTADKRRPITLKYNHNEYQFAVMKTLYANDNHKISPVLYEIGEVHSVTETLEILSAFEAVYFIEKAAGVPLGEIQERYLGRLYKVQVPEEGEEFVKEFVKFRLNSTISLYEGSRIFF